MRIIQSGALQTSKCDVISTDHRESPGRRTQFRSRPPTARMAMDVSIASRNNQNDPHHDPNRQSTNRSEAADARRNLMLAPTRRVSPLRHGLRMGLAGGISVALIFCIMLSVANKLGSGRPILNGAVLVISVFAGIYVGVLAWQKQSRPQPVSRGRCPDCGRESTDGADCCALCGRPNSPA